MAGINLSKAVRSNLLSLQSTAAAMAKTQERLATGLKVNSALDWMEARVLPTCTAVMVTHAELLQLLAGGGGRCGLYCTLLFG